MLSVTQTCTSATGTTHDHHLRIQLEPSSSSSSSLQLQHQDLHARAARSKPTVTTQPSTHVKPKPKAQGEAKGKAQGQAEGQEPAHQHHRRIQGQEARDAPTAGGAPSAANPTFSFALPGPAPVGVPNFFIDIFRIPPFLLPIYQAAGIQYDVPWQVLAGINEIETDYGRNLSVSSAGAVGWMQFMPATWKTWGVDANGDGVRDPYNPVDAIFSAARYLAGRRARARTSRRRSSPTTTPAGTSSRCCCARS